MVEQIKSGSGAISPETFSEHQRQLATCLSGQAGEQLAPIAHLFNPYPLTIPAIDYEILQRLQTVLHKAITRLVSNYFNDVRIRLMMPLSEDVVHILRCAEETMEKYKIGAYRPDFLHADSGDISVCEINARFPANGFLLTHYLNNSLSKLDYFKSMQSNHRGKLPVGKNYLQTFMDWLCQNSRVGRGRANSPIYIVKKYEKGLEIHLLHKELNDSGFPCRIVDESKLNIFAEQFSRNRLIFELHQHEILAPQNHRAISQIVKRSICFNDLRTIFIVHDKRLLALMHCVDIMRDYLSVDELAFLSSHIVPTYTIKNCGAILSEALAHPDDWMLKANSLGKGQGVIAGKSLSKDVWRKVIQVAAGSDYVLQRYVKQREIQVTTSLAGEVLYRAMPIVGSMLCIDDNFLGPGIYRLSANDTVNIANGATILLPIPCAPPLKRTNTFQTIGS